MSTETVAIKIASLALEDEPRAYEAPSLYVHATAPVVPVKTRVDAMPEAWALNGSGTFDFTTFMNGLSVMKWRRYTVARRFVLRLTYKGAAASIWQTRADSFAWEPEVMEDTRRSLPASGAWRELELPLVEWGGEVLIGARIETEGVLLKRPATHVLLMDDDIELSPESVKRTYALLRIARDAYRDAFVSGAMMKAEEPDIRIEDTASCPSRAIADPRNPSCA